MDAGRLLERCAKQDEASAAAEMGAWRAAHGPTAFRRTGAFARSTSDPGLRMLALAMPRIPRRSRWPVACARTRAPAPMRSCGWLSIGRMSRLRWTPPPRRCSSRRWPCCSRTGLEEIVAKAARKTTFRLASARRT